MVMKKVTAAHYAARILQQWSHSYALNMMDAAAGMALHVIRLHISDRHLR